MAQIIDGKAVSASVKEEVAAETAKLRDEHGLKVGLAVVIVGSDPASRVYVNNKKKACEAVGFQSYEYALDESTTQEQLLDLVEVLNRDSRVNGILVQLPLPKHIDENAVINAINPEKDADCFHPINVGKMLIGEPDFLPATPAGVLEMLKRRGIQTAGKHAVVVGRSNIVGKPMAAILMQRGVDATVTVANSRTENLAEITRTADILIAAVGKPGFVTADMVKDGAVVIDVGTNRIDDPASPKGSRLVGDVDFEHVKDKASWITPVPGGVGPMTICMLMANAVRAAEKASR